MNEELGSVSLLEGRIDGAPKEDNGDPLVGLRKLDRGGSYQELRDLAGPEGVPRGGDGLLVVDCFKDKLRAVPKESRCAEEAPLKWSAGQIVGDEAPIDALR